MIFFLAAQSVVDVVVDVAADVVDDDLAKTAAGLKMAKAAARIASCKHDAFLRILDGPLIDVVVKSVSRTGCLVVWNREPMCR